MERVLSVVKNAAWLVIPMLFVHFMSFDENVMYNRALVLGYGEFWRLFTANFAHFNDSHLWLNVFGVFVATILFRDTIPLKTWVSAWIVVMLGSTVHLLFDSNIFWYVGMSGAIYGIFAFGATRMVQDDSSGFGWFLLGLLCMKLFMDTVYTNPAAELLDMPVVDSAHIAGAVTGFLFALFTNTEFWKIKIDKQTELV